MGKKVHMRTSKKGVSCGMKVPIDDMGTPPNSLKLTGDPSCVTCKSCLKKIASEKVWVGKKDFFSTGNVLRITENGSGKWEVILYMHGYEVGNIRKRDGGKQYVTANTAKHAAKCFRTGMSASSKWLRIVKD